MLEKLDAIKQRYEELTAALSDPAAAGDQNRYRELSKERAAIAEVTEAYDAYLEMARQTGELAEMYALETSHDMRELIEDERRELAERMKRAEEELRIKLIPPDPNDDRNVIMEIRAGTGGDEAALFAGDLVRLYQRYAERHNIRSELMSASLTEGGGFKEAVLSMSGHSVYMRLKFESGVHRVQRVPETENQGRIHTSAATVAVLPEAEDVELTINPSELQIDTYRAGGAGGQHVNKTDSAIRITHLPTGLVVQCQDERSQFKNKDKAMRVLKSRLLDLYRSEQEGREAAERRSQVGSGDRSQRIRTYNFPQGRVTDHRINLTVYKLESFMDGDIDEMIEALQVADRAARLSGAAE